MVLEPRPRPRVTTPGAAPSRLATLLLLAGSVQFAVAIARLLPTAIAANGWLLGLVVSLITAAVYGVAELVQRAAAPRHRSTFSHWYLLAGICTFFVAQLAA